MNILLFGLSITFSTTTQNHRHQFETLMRLTVISYFFENHIFKKTGHALMICVKFLGFENVFIILCAFENI